MPNKIKVRKVDAVWWVTLPTNIPKQECVVFDRFTDALAFIHLELSPTLRALRGRKPW